MPRRSTSATEKAADSPVVERRSTRSSARQSVETAADVTTPAKQQAGEKSKTSSPVKPSPSQSGSKRGRPSKRQSNSTVDDNEPKTDEGKLDISKETVEADPAGSKSQEEAAAEPSESAASGVPVVSPVKDGSEKATEAISVEAAKSEEPAAENKKRPRDEESEESNVKKLRSDEVSTGDEAEKTEKVLKPVAAEVETPAEKMDTTTTDGASAPVEAAEENKPSEQTESKNIESETGVEVNGGASATPTSGTTVTETVADVPASKKSVTAEVETAEEVEGALKQNGCHETTEVPAADVVC